MKRIIVDLDHTICVAENGDYAGARPVPDVIARLREYRETGFEIAIHTSRQMRTYQGNLGKIAANTLPVIVDWLQRHDVPYDEIHIGKPWCGEEGFYVDDRAVRPDEFARLGHSELLALMGGPR